MNLIFRLKYESQWGQQVFICGNNELLGHSFEKNALPLIYQNEGIWEIELDVKEQIEPLQYFYFILNEDGTKQYAGLNYTIDFNSIKSLYSLILYFFRVEILYFSNNRCKSFFAVFCRSSKKKCSISIS